MGRLKYDGYVTGMCLVYWLVATVRCQYWSKDARAEACLYNVLSVGNRLAGVLAGSTSLAIS